MTSRVCAHHRQPPQLSTHPLTIVASQNRPAERRGKMHVSETGAAPLYGNLLWQQDLAPVFLNRRGLVWAGPCWWCLTETSGLLLWCNLEASFVHLRHADKDLCVYDAATYEEGRCF